MNTQKKIIIIVTIIFLLILVGLYVAFRQFSENGVSVFNLGGGESGSGIFGGGQFGTSDRGELDDTTSGELGAPPQLRQLSALPSTGGVMFARGANVVIRYIERATGHVFETTTTSLETKRVSNTTIPRIQHSVWASDGSSVLLQYLNEDEIIRTFYGAIEDATTNLDGWFLDNNILTTAVDDTGSSFSLRKSGGLIEGFISNFDGTKSRGVFSSPILDWRTWKSEDATLLSTKASNNILGHLFRLNTTSGTLTKILSGNGLITLPSPDLSYILYSTSNPTETSLYLYDTDSKTSIQMPFRTLAEKCVWTKDSTLVYCASPFLVDVGEYPDDWYKGLVFFSDDIWSFDPSTNTETLVFDVEAGGNNFDITHLQVNHATSTTLLFTNKRDLTLWSYSL